MRGWLRASVFDGGDHAPQRFVVGLVGGGAGGAAVEHGAHGDGEHLLGDILVNGVVGEARQRVGDGADFDFGFVGVAEFENFLRDAAHLRVGEQMQAGDGRGISAPGTARLFRGFREVLSQILTTCASVPDPLSAQ